MSVGRYNVERTEPPEFDRDAKNAGYLKTPRLLIFRADMVSILKLRGHLMKNSLFSRRDSKRRRAV
jgi:hypothetical protein